MPKAITLLQRFGLFAPKLADPADTAEPASVKDDMFTLRLQRLRRVQAQQASTLLFKNRRSHQGA